MQATARLLVKYSCKVLEENPHSYFIPVEQGNKMHKFKIAALLMIVTLLSYIIFSYAKVEILTKLYVNEFPHDRYPGTSIQLEKVFRYKNGHSVLYVVTSKSNGLCKEGYYLYFVKKDDKWVSDSKKISELIWSSCGSKDGFTWPLYFR